MSSGYSRKLLAKNSDPQNIVNGGVGATFRILFGGPPTGWVWLIEQAEVTLNFPTASAITKPMSALVAGEQPNTAQIDVSGDRFTQEARVLSVIEGFIVQTVFPIYNRILITDEQTFRVTVIAKNDTAATVNGVYVGARVQLLELPTDPYQPGVSVPPEADLVLPT